MGTMAQDAPVKDEAESIAAATQTRLWTEIDQKRTEFQEYLQKKTVGSLWWKKSLAQYATEQKWQLADIEKQVTDYNQSWFGWWDRLFAEITNKKRWLMYEKSKQHLSEIFPAFVETVADPLRLKQTSQLKALNQYQLTSIQNAFYFAEIPSSIRKLLQSIARVVQELWQLAKPEDSMQFSKAAKKLSLSPLKKAEAEGSPKMFSAPAPVLAASHKAAEVKKVAKAEEAIKAKEYIDAYVLYAQLCVFLNLKVGEVKLNEVQASLDTLKKTIEESKVMDGKNIAHDIVKSYLDLIAANPRINLLAQSVAPPVPMTEDIKQACAKKANIDNRQKVQAYLKSAQAKLTLSESYRLAEYCGELGMDWKMMEAPIAEREVNFYYKQRARKLHPDHAMLQGLYEKVTLDEYKKIQLYYTEKFKEFSSSDVHEFDKKQIFSAHLNKLLVIPHQEFKDEERLFVFKSYQKGQYKLKRANLWLEEVTQLYPRHHEAYRIFKEKAEKLTEQVLPIEEEEKYFREIETFERENLLPIEDKLFELDKQREIVYEEADRIWAYVESFIRKQPNPSVLLKPTQDSLMLPPPEKAANGAAHAASMLDEKHQAVPQDKIKEIAPFTRERISIELIKERCRSKREGEKIKRTGEQINRAGEKINRTGEEIKRTGEQINRTGKEINRAGEEIKREGEKIKQESAEAKRKHAEEDLIALNEMEEDLKQPDYTEGSRKILLVRVKSLKDMLERQGAIPLTELRTLRQLFKDHRLLAESQFADSQKQTKLQDGDSKQAKATVPVVTGTPLAANTTVSASASRLGLYASTAAKIAEEKHKQVKAASVGISVNSLALTGSPVSK